MKQEINGKNITNASKGLAAKSMEAVIMRFNRLGFCGKIGVVFGICVVVVNLALAAIYGVSINGAIGVIFGLSFAVCGFAYPLASKLIKTLIKSAFAFAALFLLLIACLIASEGIKNTATFNEDAVIILGCGIRGEELSIMLKSRVDSAIEYIRRNPNALIIATGGQGYGEDISEAEAIKRYLILNGAREERIIIEDRSRNTYENFANAKGILDSHFNGDRYAVAVATSDFHMFRALAIAKRYGINAASYNAPLKWYLKAASFLRETLSIIKLWLI
ncbi:MAG: YdcF family protein [Helicobacteraceae bacterium]|jgi:uncharacterized SAM-binding protein YcdF (DUF218 family)|nr:YdcF family protein [Helicobacteraceae bacterium]